MDKKQFTGREKGGQSVVDQKVLTAFKDLKEDLCYLAMETGKPRD